MPSQHTVASVLMSFALVAWRTKNNFRSPSKYGSPDEIKNSLTTYQWSPDNPVPAYAIEEHDLLAEMTEREAKWNAIKASTNPGPDTLAEKAVFEMLFTEPVDPAKPDGERRLIKPEYDGNAGFRRSSVYFAAMVARFKNKATDPSLEINGLVPIRVMVYKTIAERIIDQQLENEMQGKGTVKVDDLDKLRVTKALFDEGCKETEIRHLYSSSTGQKTYGLCQADLNWPKLGILRRLGLTAESSEWIPWGPVRGADMVKFNNRFEAHRKVREGLPLKEAEKGLPPISEEEMAQYFADKLTEALGGNAPKSMKKTDIESAAKNHKLLLVRSAFDSVVGNTQVNLKPFMEYAEPLNEVTALIKEGKGEHAKAIVENAKSLPVDFQAKLARVIKLGKVAELEAAINTILNPPAPTPVVTPTPAPAPAAPAPAPAVTNGGKKGK